MSSSPVTGRSGLASSGTSRPSALPAVRNDENAAAASVLLLPGHASTHATDARLLLRTTLLIEWYMTLPLPKPTTLLWKHAQQALIRAWRPNGYSAADIRIALGQLPSAE